ncbi:asparagine synthase (glutamine-hydrolyzing) [Simiduia litorea]|uniref:asparagine synthase (glutamine-hydrolyzing) n=1 Tax=Simiduia litorea TaxID=1435348 RepID=UPI0036F35570
MIGFTIAGDGSFDTSNVARRMLEAIKHRGPDSNGIWKENNSQLILGHARLSILDLSSAGHQPMLSACEQYVISFNGEIYNHLALRKQLEIESKAPRWRGHSDTETLLACFVAWGIKKTLQALVGMFAFALWDRQLQVLTLARDRMGEKPLYWGWSKGVLLFASELKALKEHPSFNNIIDRGALNLFLRHSYIPAPYSIYVGINKLMPAHYVQIPLQGDHDSSLSAQPTAYWSVNDVVENGLANPFVGSADDAINSVEAQLSKSIASQMLADVPLGAFLSGGIDSSTVVALMQAQSDRPISTFTIGFEEGGYNEATHAKAVAKLLGTDHTELYVSSADALSVVPLLPRMYCEPFADASQIPTYLVSQMAKHNVTVALSGDGGDELFGGYNRYLAVSSVWRPMQRVPHFLRNAATGFLRGVPPSRWDKIFEAIKPITPKKFHLSTPGDKARKLADVMAISDGQAFYRQLTSQWSDPASVVINGVEPPTLISTSSAWPTTDNIEHAMMAMDSQMYMPDDILTKVDRAAMAISLETRVPMLDHNMVELAWKMPFEFKIRDGRGKWLLRQVLYRHVPAELIERPKMGFAIPLDQWLRGPLRGWADALLDETRLKFEGFFHPEPIRKMWAEHLSGRKSWHQSLWCVLMFQAWLEENQ